MRSELIAGIRQLCFPDNCLLCRTYLNNNHQTQLCINCLAQISLNTPPFCARCSIHLDHYSEDSICKECRGKTLAVDRLWSACLYQDPLPKLVHAFKYQGKTSLRRTFVQLMLDFITLYHVPLEDFDLIAPIPLHPVRLRERGYNQSELLSADLSARLQLPHAPSLLQRVSPSASQTTMGLKQRWTNIQGAFKINPLMTAAGRSILLVDDLRTTNATANAAAAALKDTGAAFVGIITLAAAM